MLRVTLAQMRRSLGRLAAAGIAIAIGTAFVTATLIAGDVFSRTTTDALTARYGDADVVVSGPGADDSLALVRTAPGVAAAAPLELGYVQLSAGTRSEALALVAQSPVAGFDTLEPTEGSLAHAGELTLPPETADRLDVGVGDRVQVTYMPAGGGTDQFQQVTVSGIVSDPSGAWTQLGGVGTATSADLLRWNNGDPLGTQVVLAASTDPHATIDALAPRLPDDTVAQTKQQAADDAVKQLSDDGTDFVVMLVLGFAAVALLVAGLVISNTFQVLVAQRTRTLALLRCVGARRSQLRGSVVLEATILGVGSSVVGIVGGALVAQGALWALDGADVGGALPATIHVAAATVLVPLVVGTLVTVVASLVPARAATRVAPVAALRPLDTAPVRSIAGTVRLVLSLVLTVGGLVGLLGAIAAAHVSPLLGLGLGILAGAASFVGVLLGAVFWVPRVVDVVGRTITGTGTSARLAAANSVRNPRRTAATSAALLIGVTLVSMMTTGAASARASVSEGLDQHYYVDMQLTSTTGKSTDDGQNFRPDPLPADTLDEVLAVDGVADAAELTEAVLVGGDGSQRDVVGIDPARARAVLRDDTVVRDLTVDVILTSDDVPEGTGGIEVTATVAGLPAGGRGLTLERVHSPVQTAAQPAIVTRKTLDALAPDAPATTMWVRIAPGASAASVLDDVRQVVGSDVYVQSNGAEREGYEQVIDQLLAIVVGLLGVAVLIALIGVANTLSLSVLERRRESATLRAIGLSRRQLRLSLGIEGMLIAGVGGLLGAGLGLLYGWAGSAIVFGSFGSLHLAVPWVDLLVVIVVAVAAGLLASVLPARRAARTSPVAALAVD
ncbi:FtsX-like permease family protein [Cellulomonas sp. JH27-2]|uniref:ABC transporter permease n=1 Tax=Cellulomonas sp. JH27-2 TaxID=2774139 RepID=UPI00177E1D12|nr:FtsX-like permease family protein [Cellulomonas sp. JH27-2]MBD8060410.1 FtsX-like permease family protein [Cellulomonas sp. JH27-2]